MSRMMPVFACVLMLLTASAFAANPAGHWEGAIELPGAALGVKVDLAETGGAWGGTIDIPMQGALGLKLAGVRVAADSVTFAIEGIPGAPTFRGVQADTTLAGTFSQGGQSFPFHLGRAVMAAPKRPQEPKPPFPYTAEDVGYADGDVHLAATLTLPPGQGPFPAAVLITGSGPQDRDEALFGHKPFAVLADALTRRGIAVLRADDRGVGGSTGNRRTSTSADYAQDALAGVRYLQTRPEIDRRRIGLVGHSEGGLIAPMVAAEAPDEIAYIVLMAGPGVPLGDVVKRQVGLISAASGADSAAVADEVALTSLVIDMIAAGSDSAAVRARFEQAVRDAAAATGQPVTDEQVNQLADANLRGVFSPWFRYALTLDPVKALRQVHCPVLAINGELDRQVDPDQNLYPIEKALAEAGNPDVTIARMPMLNHMLQTARTGAPAEYAAIEETMSPAALALIGDWITERFGSR
ncbi:MAG TPA: alpha/beta fold hydrolase [Candidatus Krumholzibacteria bacterium]|nr:alpha/beta fold hydrolase [Candidatus Krumholzibacteria bacterium]